MNSFDNYLLCEQKYNTSMNILEDEIREYIKNHWRSDLEFYVEVDYCHIEITLTEEVNLEYFETFIIKKLCKKYDVIVSYKEITTSPTYNDHFVVEWGLAKRYEKQS